MAKSKINSVPVWLDEEIAGCKSFINTLSERPETAQLNDAIEGQKNMLAIAAALLESAAMSPAWKALDRRISNQNIGYCLAHEIHYIRSSFRTFQRMSRTERLDYARRIRATSLELAKLLRPARELSRSAYKLIEAESIDGKKPYAWLAPNFICDWLPDVLEHLAKAAVTWGDHFDPVVHKPNAVNAERLFFIRELTRVFRRSFDQPLRNCVFLITSVFFSVDGLTHNDIAKLAP